MTTFNSKNHKSKLALLFIALTLTVGFSYLHLPQQSYALDEDPDEISEAELVEAFQDVGINGYGAVTDYISCFEQSDGSCDDEQVLEHFIDFIEAGGEDLYDLTRDYILQELPNDISDDLPDDFPDLP